MRKAIEVLRGWRGDAPLELAHLTMRRFLLSYALVAFVPPLLVLAWIAATAPLLKTKAFLAALLPVLLVIGIVGMTQSVADRLAVWRDANSAEDLAKKRLAMGLSQGTGTLVAGLIFWTMTGFRRDLLSVQLVAAVFWFAMICLRRYAFDAWYVNMIRQSQTKGILS